MDSESYKAHHVEHILVCLSCDARFDTQDSLDMHVKSVHESILSVPKKYCHILNHETRKLTIFSLIALNVDIAMPHFTTHGSCKATSANFTTKGRCFGNPSPSHLPYHQSLRERHPRLRKILFGD